MMRRVHEIANRQLPVPMLILAVLTLLALSGLTLWATFPPMPIP